MTFFFFKVIILQSKIKQVDWSTSKISRIMKIVFICV